MSLKERLQEDWKQALKSGDKFKASTITMAKAAVLQVEKSDGLKLDDNDEQVIQILAKEVKMRRESLLEFEKGNRQDLIDQNNAEIEILLSYLPKQLTKEEIAEYVKIGIKEVGANSVKDMGKVMTVLKPRLNGRADGKLISQIIKEYLNKWLKGSILNLFYTLWNYDFIFIYLNWRKAISPVIWLERGGSAAFFIFCKHLFKIYIIS